VVSHFVGLGFPASFDYVGTRDYSAWLALPVALRFWHSLGAEDARAYRCALIDKATVAMARIGAQPIADEGLGCSMRAFRLPQSRAAAMEDIDALVRPLWERHRIQSMAVAFGGALLLRISAQAYVDEGDIAALVSALERDGWPGASERGAVPAFAGTTTR
jgi:isopenicillin-N epimerase